MQGARVRYELQVKAVSPGVGGADAFAGMNPALLQREGNVDMDEGRVWAGDLYEEGPITNPAEAYAHFSPGGDTEAWLDRNEDGTLTGWVREGDQVWRYSDVEAWALDVDGAQMPRIDAGAGAAPDGGMTDPAAPGGAPAEPDPIQGDDNAVPQGDGMADPASPADAHAEAEEAVGEPVDDDGFVNPFAEQLDGLEEETDPDGDTSELTDADGDPADEQISADAPDPDDPDTPGEDEDPDAGSAEDQDPSEPAPDPSAPGDPGDEPEDRGAEPEDDPDAVPAEPAEGDDDEDDEDDEKDGPETEEDRLFKKKGQKKSLDRGIAAGPVRRPRGTVRPRRATK